MEAMVKTITHYTLALFLWGIFLVAVIFYKTYASRKVFVFGYLNEPKLSNAPTSSLQTLEDKNTTVQAIAQVPVAPIALPAQEVKPTEASSMTTDASKMKFVSGTFLLIGDSMMTVGFGPTLEKMLLQHQDLVVIRLGKSSTGLNRRDYFDWYDKTNQALETYKPDVLIVSFGANDGQKIESDEHVTYDVYSKGWKDVYTKRVEEYLALVHAKVKKIYWVGQPIPGNEDFFGKFSIINPIYRDECAKVANCTFINTWDRFAVDGKFSALVADSDGKIATVKGPDGVHVTLHGGKIMSEEIITSINDDFPLRAK